MTHRVPVQLRQRQRWPVPDPIALAALVDQGMGPRDIAAALDIPPPVVAYRIRQVGLVVKARPGRRPDFPDHASQPRNPHPVPRSRVDPARLALLVAAGMRVAELERTLHVHRRTLHRAAARAGLVLPARVRRTPDRAGWVVLIVEHGLDVPALAKATGLRRDYVRNVLVEHGLLRTWWGRRGKRFAEWTMGED